MVKAVSANGKYIRDLATHPVVYLRPYELASHWQISPAHLLEHIRTGRLKAIRFGPRSFRIHRRDATNFEFLMRRGREREEQ